MVPVFLLIEYAGKCGLRTVMGLNCCMAVLSIDLPEKCMIWNGDNCE